MITDTITSSNGVASSASTDPVKNISSDFQTFLEMLTVQMENQDPLNPTESSDFAVQLATFSSVEQQVQTNELLAALGNQMTTSGMADVATWVGQQARSEAPTYFNGTPITISPRTAATADQAELVVRDGAGNQVQTLQLALDGEQVEWAGVGERGTPLPAGLYSFEVVSRVDGEIIATSPAETYATVREVRNDGGTISVLMDGDVSVVASKISALREPA